MLKCRPSAVMLMGLPGSLRMESPSTSTPVTLSVYRPMPAMEKRDTLSTARPRVP